MKNTSTEVKKRKRYLKHLLSLSIFNRFMYVDLG